METLLDALEVLGSLYLGKLIFWDIEWSILETLLDALEVMRSLYSRKLIFRDVD